MESHHPCCKHMAAYWIQLELEQQSALHRLIILYNICIIKYYINYIV